MYFDLVFVGGSFMAGNMLATDMSFKGLMYFISVMLIIRDIWFSHMLRHARFHIASGAHNEIENLFLLFVTLLMLHVEKTSVIVDPGSGVAMSFTIIYLVIATFNCLYDLEYTIEDVDDVQHKRQRTHHRMPVLKEAITICVLIGALAYIIMYHDSTLDFMWIPWILATQAYEPINLLFLYYSRQRDTFKHDVRQPCAGGASCPAHLRPVGHTRCHNTRTHTHNTAAALHRRP